MKASIEEYAATRRVAFAWSVLAAAAVVFSFLCTLTLALACLALPLLMWKLVLHGFSFAAAIVLLPLFGVVAGLSILWALVPRAQRFEPSGVRLDLLQQKRLASELALVAGALHEPVQQEVYLIADARAYVTERKRTWRTGRQKALALGLPLIGTLSVAEFRALLAHEFAHFYCGDTRLLPWVNRGRNMMIRVYTNLSPEASLMGFLAHFILLAVPYALLMRGIRFYWIRFMGLANFISRRQELRSDEIAARLAGSQALVGALQKITQCAAVARPYWTSVILPVVARGYQPQLADTFARYLATPHIAAKASAQLMSALQKNRSGPLETHPPLNTRIDQVSAFAFPSEDVAASTESAMSLFHDLPKLETDLLRQVAPSAKIDLLKPLLWGTSGAAMYLPLWRQQAASLLPLLAQKKIASLPDLARNPKQFADRITMPAGKMVSNRQRDELAASLLSIALTVALVDRGWDLHVEPASSVLQHEQVTLAASTVATRLQTGELPASEWMAFCAATGIGEYPLVGPSRVA